MLRSPRTLLATTTYEGVTEPFSSLSLILSQSASEGNRFATTTKRRTHTINEDPYRGGGGGSTRSSSVTDGLSQVLEALGNV